jgi:hypothetical protein
MDRWIVVDGKEQSKTKGERKLCMGFTLKANTLDHRLYIIVYHLF